MRLRANVSRARQGGEPRSKRLLRDARREQKSEPNIHVDTEEKAEKLVVGV